MCKTTLSALLILAFVAVALPACSSPDTSTVPRPTPTVEQEGFRVAVKGMSCPIRCPQDVKHQLGNAPGVVSVTIDYQDKSAYCVVEKGTDPEAVVAVLKPPYSGEVLN